MSTSEAQPHDPAPLLAVIVPAHNAAAELRVTLPALQSSDLPRSEWELVVVDDASTDDTAAVAVAHANAVVRLTGAPHGPACARNRGADNSSAAVLVFLDADVRVHQDTLRLLAEALAADPGLAAVFGSYDDEPASPGLVSQFRNLLHHYVHSASPGPAETFWAGCGAVRRRAFAEVDGFDAARYPRPSIEDIELGRRLRRGGHAIELRPDIQATHLKRWTLGSMVLTDLRARGIPWMQLLLEEGLASTPATLNLRGRERAATALTGGLVLSLAAALVTNPLPPLLVALGALLGVVALNRGFYGFLAARRGTTFAVRAIPLHLLFYLVGGCAAAVAMLRYAATRWRPSPAPAATGLEHGDLRS